jgi:hypothetical protein
MINMTNPDQTVVVKLSDLDFLANVVADIDSENATPPHVFKQHKISSLADLGHALIARMAGEFSETIYPSGD